MTFRGHVKNGVVVLDESADLPEGVAVRVEMSEPSVDVPQAEPNGTSLSQKLLRHAGKAQGLPTDAALNLDHYLYGTPKR